ncbi:hypothetical protein Z043_108649 [Scleropages formosus]|uniref:Uncharacterized protein n=2 Tax=Scleropages formosus TaxID=113540 RepID=A0A0P7VG05_SCLFO|nr:hypothetical protein Z043_108649 [Scleropages formosus]
MILPETHTPAGRFRLAQSAVGLVGCACVIYAVWMPHWLGDQGLWTRSNDTALDADQTRGSFLEEAECVFAVLSSLMGLSAGALCLVFGLCWTSQTVRSYSNTRSLLMVGQALYPTTLLLITLVPTGFFFLLCWSLFTHQHWTEISADPGQLGFCYWLGAVGLVLLLAVLPVIFLVEQCVVPDPLPELKRAYETLWCTPLPGYGLHSLSDSDNHYGDDFIRGHPGYLSFP